MSSPGAGVPARVSVVVAVLLLVLAGVLLSARSADGQSTVTRLDAATAVEAGIAVSREVFADGATGHVILVRDDRFADALVAGPLAGELPDLAPILFTPGDELDPAVAQEIDRVTGGTGVVHIIGGTVAVAGPVATALEDGGYAVQRVAGQTRLETAQAVFDTYFADDLAGGEVMIARAFGVTADESDAWPDAITGGALGASRGIPILLTPTDEIPAAVLTQIESAGAGAALVLGGTAAVSDDVAEALEEVVEEVVRADGTTREGTGVAVATDLFGITALSADDVAVLVNGRSSFAFGLAASALAAAGSGPGEAPVLLVTEDSPTADCATGEEVATPTACYLSADGTQPGAIVLVGDTDQISADVETAVAALRGGAADADEGALSPVTSPLDDLLPPLPES